MELIIVIAIIAILTCVAAPQYIKYVDKSRAAIDMNTAASIESVIITLCVDEVITGDDPDYVTWDTERSNRAKAADVVFSVDFTPDGTPIVTTNVDYSTWND